MRRSLAYAVLALVVVALIAAVWSLQVARRGERAWTVPTDAAPARIEVGMPPGPHTALPPAARPRA